MQKSKWLISVLLLCASCAPYKPLFIQVVSDHRVVTVETVDALIASIESDMQSKNNMSAEDKKAVNDLIDRLKFVKQGSIVMEKYVMNQADEETLAKVLHGKLGK